VSAELGHRLVDAWARWMRVPWWAPWWALATWPFHGQPDGGGRWNDDEVGRWWITTAFAIVLVVWIVLVAPWL
jgi:hypothetical protein